MWGSDYPHDEGTYPYTTRAPPPGVQRPRARAGPADPRRQRRRALRLRPRRRCSPLADQFGPTVAEVAAAPHRAARPTPTRRWSTRPSSSPPPAEPGTSHNRAVDGGPGDRPPARVTPQGEAMTTQNPSNVPPIDDWNRLLDGRVAVVTGGGDRHRRGHRPGCSPATAPTSRSPRSTPTAPQRAVADITAAGGSARAHVVDVTHRGGRRRPGRGRARRAPATWTCW